MGGGEYAEGVYCTCMEMRVIFNVETLQLRNI